MGSIYIGMRQRVLYCGKYKCVRRRGPYIGMGQRVMWQIQVCAEMLVLWDWCSRPERQGKGQGDELSLLNCFLPLVRSSVAA